MARTSSALVALDPDELVDEAKPKSLKQLERTVEGNAMKGAVLWKAAAEALVEIRDRKLWKLAKAPEGTAPELLAKDGITYKNFVTYAEARFGFKKTYAYDLVKAATRKPEALTEGEARAELKAERGTSPLTVEAAIERITKAWNRFEDSAGDTRDRAIDNEDFVKAYDKAVGKMGEALHAFLTKFVTIEGTAEAVEPAADVQQD